MTDKSQDKEDEQRRAYRVEGLDCAEEVSALDQTVADLEGVSDVNYHVMKGRMTVTFDPDRTGPEEIADAVEAAGLRAIPWEHAGERDAEASFWERRGRLLTTSLSGALLVAGFITHWIIHGDVLHVLAAGHGAGDGSYPLLPMLLYGAAVVSGAWFVAPKALSAARRLSPDMNLLMALAILGAAAIGEWFEAATVSFLFAVSLLLEQWSVGRARRAISSLLDLSPATARHIPPGEDEVRTDPVEEVPVGSTVLVRPGEKIPLDGEVVEGSSSVNQAPITGESEPVRKEGGDGVYAGTINGDGAFRFRATKPAEDTTLAHIIHLVEKAQSRRAAAEKWVDRFARYYTPAMMGFAATLALLPPLVLGGGWGDWFYRGLVIMVIACPCALVISTPVTVVSGLASAARSGVLIKGGVFLEQASNLRGVALDKTGTITEGQPSVQQVVPFNHHSEQQLLSIAAALEKPSEHPLARAIVEYAAERGVDPAPASGFQAIKGEGAEASVEGREFWIGSHKMMEKKGEETPAIHDKAEELEDAGHSVVALGNENHVCGLISVADPVRTEAAESIRSLKQQGIEEVLMLTGDNEGTARAVAGAAGVDQYRSELLPEDKVDAVREFGERLGSVAMVGDGVNDAPAMATSRLGVAMGAMGTDVAIETADVALMSDDLPRLPWLIGHSHRVLRIIQQNVIFALGLKGLFILLALFGMATLWMAIAADMGASLLVIFNGLRALRVVKT